MELVDQFFAVTDEGDEYQVLVYQHQSTFRPLSGPSQRPSGATEFQLADGRGVSPIGSPDLFEIVDTGQRIRRLP
jgi:hypothetical protein